MLLGRRLFLISALLGSLCLAGLVTALVWYTASARPQAYPKAVYDGMRLPSLSARHLKDCWQVLLVNGWDYHTTAKPVEVLYWQLSQGYMSNFRYYDSVFHESQNFVGGLVWARVLETYVESDTHISRIKSTAKDSLSIGPCP